LAAIPAPAPRDSKGRVALRRIGGGRLLALMASALVTIGVLVFSGSSASVGTTPTSPPGAPCGQLTTRALAATDGKVAERIYRDELGGPATGHDRHQVETYAPLLDALAEGNRARVHEAVVALVYSGTHIVRLRVSQNGALLADVGGPYIIAPTGGNLYDHGRLVGSYLLSVQDDRGFVGLETRLVSTPVVLYVGRKRLPVIGAVHANFAPLPAEAQVVVHGHPFQAYSFDAKAYPAGTLRITLLHPMVPPSTLSCSAVDLAEIGRIGRAIWHRFMVDGAPISGFVTFTQRISGALTYVRSGAGEVAGSTQPGPPVIPASGILRFNGVSYEVTSFAAASPTGPVRVYQLVAP
jgi:hypothetical protein